jgi:hypothetical protein
MIRIGILLIALAWSAVAQDLSSVAGLSFQAQQSASEDPDYRKGRQELDARQWDQAIASFDAAAAKKGALAAGALYWKAYALNRTARVQEALATIDALRQEYPKSRWNTDAEALDVEIRGRGGAPVSPGAEPNEDLKLMAINSLMQSDPEKAFPILEKLLKSNNSAQVKERALFVLTQSPAPGARKLLSDMAKGTSNPDLQLKAIRYLGMMGNQEARNELASIYKSSSDKNIKRSILQSFMLSGSRSFLLNAAKTERDPELRRDAIRQLMLTGGQDELWQMYQTDSSVDDKREILQSMFLGGNSSKLLDVARNEKDPSLRIAAIKSLGLMGGNGRGDALVSIYRSGQNREVKDAVLNALFLQQNGKALVDLARNESNPEMKRRVVQKLSLIHSKDATDYMMELLK